MKSKKETFANLLLSHGYRYDLRPVFDDFLTLTLCAFSQNPATGRSYDEDLYMQTIAKYPKDIVINLFPKLLALLISEMEDRVGSHSGTDVLGDFYEMNFCRKGTGQFFTPWPICKLMASCLYDDQPENNRTLRILDPTCGSGRTLLAGADYFGCKHSYWGIDIDHTCVKMTAINLFLNGIFYGEVLCADALSPDDFHMSYKLSFLPFGIFRIDNKEQSLLWYMKNATFFDMHGKVKEDLLAKMKDVGTTGIGSQIQLF